VHQRQIGEGDTCTPAQAAALGGSMTLLPGVLEPTRPEQKTSPYSKAGKNAPIMRHGVDGESSTPSQTVPEETGK
jgi:hypothetical protein